MRMRSCIVLVLGALGACGDSLPASIAFDPEADLASEKTFFQFPFPSDLRMNGDKGDYTGYPTSGNVVITPVLELAKQTPGFPQQSPVYFHAADELMTIDETVSHGTTDDKIWILNVDKDSQEYGEVAPAVGRVFSTGQYINDGYVLAVAPTPGVVLLPKTTYAYVVTTSVERATGESIGRAPIVAQLAAGETPDSPWGQALPDTYAPLWQALDELQVSRDRVAAASIVTTGAPVEALATLSELVLEAFTVDVSDIALAPNGATHDNYCELVAKVTMPQFQTGKPPYDDGGLFEIEPSGLPKKQRDKEVDLRIILPLREMPGDGFPMMLYLHGSGGRSSSVVSREGSPGDVFASVGLASVGAALPLSPERYGPATDYEYLNFENLAAFRDTFRQGVLEQRLLLRAVSLVTIDSAVVAACETRNGDQLSLPNGESAYFLRADGIGAAGQSMGGMYTNLLSAVEPRIGVAVPMAAGGYWPLMIRTTNIMDNVGELLFDGLLKIPPANQSYLHPALALLTYGWPQAEPFNFMPRLAKHPLAGHPARSVFQPVGQADSYFSEPVYDAAAVAFGNQQAGNEVWPSMQSLFAAVATAGFVTYPVSGNLMSEHGDSYTGVVAQYAGQGYDGHFISLLREDVQHQYKCFLRSYFSGQTPIVVAPGEVGKDCP